MGSTRFPGKVLVEVKGKTVLRHCLERCLMIDTDVVCCAVPFGEENDPVVAEAVRCGVEVFRGSEHDVLDRYYRAALSVGADEIMRVTSDCPLIDPEVCSQVFDMLARCDYACNNMPRTWPHGLDCEAFPIGLLAWTHENASDPYMREHVTPLMREHPMVRASNLVGPGIEGRLTVDYPEDIALVEAALDAAD